MSESTRALILKHWALANARQWDEFARLLSPVVRYEVPQTREYIDSKGGYLEMFKTWPGDWRATVKSLICEEAQAVSIIEFTIESESEAGTESEVMTGISVFHIENGLISQVTDYWPEPYEPPPRATSAFKRRAQ